MAKRVMHLLLAVVAVGTLIIITLGLLQPTQSSTTTLVHHTSQVGLEQGDLAPNFTLALLNGKRISLSDYRGLPVMLNFWSIDCEGCRVEMPEMQKFYAAQQKAHKDFVILSVNVADSVPSITQFVHRMGLAYPILLDQHLSVEALYNVNAIPTAYFIDRQGMIHSMTEGPVDEATLQPIVEAISV